MIYINKKKQKKQKVDGKFIHIFFFQSLNLGWVTGLNFEIKGLILRSKHLIPSPV